MPKINHLIQRKLSELLCREARDPRLSAMITVTEVSTAPDLSHARVFVSIMGTPEEKRLALEGLKAASVFLRRELAESLTIRRVPSLDFRMDDSIERGAHMVDLIDRVMQGDNP
jgi:ribosome-binding factor A